MSKVSVFDREWIDLVFEGRNKEYGAYQLRKENPQTTMIALFCGIALIAILAAIPTLINHFKPKQAEVITPREHIVIGVIDPVEPYKPIEPPKPDEVAPKPDGGAPKSNTPTVAYTDIEVSKTPSDDIPDTRDFTDANPGNETTSGDSDGTIVIGNNPGNGPSNSTGEGKGDDTGEAISSLLVDESPMFMNGMDDFYKKVAREFDLPDTEKEMTLKVYVSFIIEKDGTMSNIKVLRDPGYGMGKEAVRVLKSIKTKWKPGKKAGKEVRTAFNLPITLNVK